MTMSDRPGRHPAGNGTTRTRRRRHLAALTLLVAAVEDGADLAGTLAQATQNFPQATQTAAVTTSDIVFTDPRRLLHGHGLGRRHLPSSVTTYPAP